MDWYDVLKAARRVGSRGQTGGGKQALEAIPFTADQLAVEAKLKDTKKSRSTDIAAGWISKFVRWGYVLRVGKEDSKGGRPVMLYRLTRWGLEFKRGPKKGGRK